MENAYYRLFKVEKINFKYYGKKSFKDGRAQDRA
jgi:hypothetical protein